MSFPYSNTALVSHLLCAVMVKYITFPYVIGPKQFNTFLDNCFLRQLRDKRRSKHLCDFSIITELRLSVVLHLPSPWAEGQATSHSLLTEVPRVSTRGQPSPRLSLPGQGPLLGHWSGADSELSGVLQLWASVSLPVR